MTAKPPSRGEKIVDFSLEGEDKCWMICRDPHLRTLRAAPRGLFGL